MAITGQGFCDRHHKEGWPLKVRKWEVGVGQRLAARQTALGGLACALSSAGGERAP